LELKLYLESLIQLRQIGSGKAKSIVYSASDKVDYEFNEGVGFVRRRKLIYNAAYNSVCTIPRMDTTRMRLTKPPIDDLVTPLMQEIWNIAKAAGHELPGEVLDEMSTQTLGHSSSRAYSKTLRRYANSKAEHNTVALTV
jgi:ketopantoate reductase